MAETEISSNWEYNAIGEFLLNLNLNSILTAQNNWRVAIKLLKRKFDEFLTQDSIKKRNTKHRNLRALFQIINKNLDIVLFLKNTKFGESSNEEFIVISSKTFCNYRDKVLLAYDERRTRSKTFVSPYLREEENADVQQITDGLVLLALHEIDESAEWIDLKYCGTAIQERLNEFVQSVTGCFICQSNFINHEEYKQHVVYHNKNSNFEYLQKNTNKLNIHLDLTYTTCKNSHYFCFDLDFDADNIVVEKFIIVQDTCMHDIPLTKNDYVYADSHLFSLHSELAIIIVYYQNTFPVIRIVEQHHFYRTEPLPGVNFKIKPIQLDRRTALKSKFKLNEFSLPAKVLEAAQCQFSAEKLIALSKDLYNYMLMEQKLTSASYITVLRLLLQIEDAYLLKCYNRLTQKKVKFQNPLREQTLKMNISYDCQVQPAPGDRVVIFSETEEAIMGSIDSFENGYITIALDDRAKCNVLYSVAIKPLRLTQRYQYDALMCMEKRTLFIAEFLFPGNLPCKLPCEICPELYNESIYENPEQLQAVTNIVSRYPKPAPYLIWGPPGTGKTTVLVESIYQLYKRDEHTRILILAGSNSACNSVALPLCQIFEKENCNDALIRVFSRTYEKNADKIDDVLLDSSNLYRDHFYPSVDNLHKYRIVVCTLSMMGRFNLSAFGQGVNNRFTHIFIDEAGACTEPETLCGFAYALANCTTQTLILAGDPKQLGAVVLCETSKRLGLGVSLMERLLKLDCYASDADGNYNTSIQTQLRRNYRSHTEIVRLYNNLYYDDKLIAKAKKESVSFGLRWHRSYNINFPIIFHAVFGIRGVAKTSSFNSKEVDTVLNYVQDLMFFGSNGKKVLQTDIGIISPYKEQCRIIERELKRRNWMHIEVGTTELYQGKEKCIIIASFVRSSTTVLGFLVEPKRFNVLLSRAKSLLILIGNPITLALNPDMARVIEECQRQNTFVEESVENILENNNRSVPPVKTTNIHEVKEIARQNNEQNVIINNTEADVVRARKQTKITHTKMELLNMNKNCTLIESTLNKRLENLNIIKNMLETTVSTTTNCTVKSTETKALTWLEKNSNKLSTITKTNIKPMVTSSVLVQQHPPASMPHLHSRNGFITHSSTNFIKTTVDYNNSSYCNSQKRQKSKEPCVIL